eukprot:gene22138-biopygen22220
MLWPGYSITRVALPRRLNFIAQLGDLLDGCNARGVLWSGHAFTHAARVACACVPTSTPTRASDRVGSGRGGTEVVVHVRIEPGQAASVRHVITGAKGEYRHTCLARAGTSAVVSPGGGGGTCFARPIAWRAAQWSALGGLSHRCSTRVPRPGSGALFFPYSERGDCHVCPPFPNV